MYEWAKVLHILAFVAWMAGLFYLPRLFVYHTRQATGSDADSTFTTMETKLLRYIMTPAMIVTIASGFWLASIVDAWAEGWFHTKLLLVALMVVFHMMLARWRRQFAEASNRHSEKFYRYANEIPTVLLIGIVILVVVRPM